MPHDYKNARFSRESRDAQVADKARMVRDYGSVPDWAQRPEAPLRASTSRASRPDLQAAFDQGCASGCSSGIRSEDTNTEPDQRVATSGADSFRVTRDRSSRTMRERPGRRQPGE